ncbi:MAG: YggS family pyridoxal phosphate-dependent enzyme [Trebonia sp.]|uniref:YggS family pyridoxal phosphate-dependent enzyme n=2 Tax=Trebonia sp. TaxID=2767075 RepID=UPI003BAE1B6E
MSQTSSSEPDPSAERRSELEKNLAEVRSRIAVACAAAGRDPGEITLIAITKTRPPADVLLLHELGLTDFGENKDQEAAPKAAAVAAALADADADAGASASAVRSQPLRWHFVGQLQTNKASSVAGYADVVHSVDRVRLVRALGAAARKAGRELTCLVQVDLDTPADPARGGVPPGQVREIAEAIEAEQNLILGGVMAIAPLGADPARAFAPLRPCSLAVRAVNPAAAIISAGMSGDLEAAIGNGATHVRIGTALLGARRPLVR